MYAYDERNQLLSGPDGTFTYTPRGTLSMTDDGSSNVAYDFDGLSRMVGYNGTVSYTYDGLDRIATRGTDTFGYSGLGLDPTSDGSFTYNRSPAQAEAALDLIAETTEAVVPGVGYEVSIGPGTCELLPGNQTFLAIEVDLLLDVVDGQALEAEVAHYWSNRADVVVVNTEAPWVTGTFDSVASSILFSASEVRGTAGFSTSAGSCSSEPVTPTSYVVPASDG